MQAERLTEVVQDWMRAIDDARSRAHLNEDTEHARSWRESHYDAYAPYDPQRPIRVPTFALSAGAGVYPLGCGGPVPTCGDVPVYGVPPLCA